MMRLSSRMLFPGSLARKVLVCVAVGSLGFGASARADIVVQDPPPPDRAVSASANIDSNFDSQSFLFSSGAGFTNNALASVSVGGIASATADQDSDIPNLTGPTMSGTGSVTGSAIVDAGATGAYSASSFFDVFFRVDLSQNYNFTGFVAYDDPSPPNFGESSVVLQDVSNGNNLYVAFVDWQNPNVVNFAELVTLNTGTLYRLTIYSTTATEGVVEGDFSFGSGSWGFNLGPQGGAVPEPSSVILLGIGGLAGLVVARRRRNRS